MRSRSADEVCWACLMELGLESALAPGTRLGPYEILGGIGTGGMGEVYRARDDRLKREVAVKVLPASFSGDPDRLRRFEREAQSASALNHPNIVSVYDVGTHDGSSYMVTELLEGHNLRERMNASPLSPAEAVEYAVQMAKGLAAAHAKGIVHRDLKPENVFVTRDGLLKILDFGIAKLSRTDGTPADDETAPGVILGTLSYMSPEQVKGEAADARSDVFSFGTILYEMLSGRTPFRRGSPAETMSAILKEEPAELSGETPGLERIVRRCLDKDPAKRFQSAAEIAFHLPNRSAPALVAAPPRMPVTRNALIGTIVLAALGIALVPILRRGARPATTSVKRIAVLPFENLGTPDDDYFADGMADAVRGKLTSLPGVAVIARSSSTPYKKTAKAPLEIARELGVSYLLTATVRWQKGAGASRVEVSPELVEVSASGAPTSVWQQSFDASLTDVFQVQSEIATRVTRSMGAALGTADAKRLAETPTSNLEAYDAFLKGEELRNTGIRPDVLRKSLAFFERAVALDPSFAPAWSRVSRISSSLYSRDRGPAYERRAREAAEKVTSLAPGGPEEYLAWASFERFVSEDYPRALEHTRMANRVAPGDASTLTLIGAIEQLLGRWGDAVEHFEQASVLDPRSTRNAELFGRTLIMLHRYSEARAVIDRGLSIVPANLDLINWKMVSYLMEGDLTAARAVLRGVFQSTDRAALVAWIAFDGDYVWALDERDLELLLTLDDRAFDDDRGIWALSLVEGYALKRDSKNVRLYAEKARQAFERQIREGVDDSERRASLGLALAYLGRKAEAIREGERAVAMTPTSKDSYVGPYFQHCLVRIYALLGEPEKALDQLEGLLKIPYSLSPELLRIDPNFDSLRGNLRFQRLVAGK